MQLFMLDSFSPTNDIRANRSIPRETVTMTRIDAKRRYIDALQRELMKTRSRNKDILNEIARISN